MWWVLSQYAGSFLLCPRYIPRGPHLHQLWEVLGALKISPVSTVAGFSKMKIWNI